MMVDILRGQNSLVQGQEIIVERLFLAIRSWQAGSLMTEVLNTYFMRVSIGCGNPGDVVNSGFLAPL